MGNHLLAVVVMLASCGAGEVLEPAPHLVFQEEPRCLSCDVAGNQPEQEQFEAAPRVSVSPTELLFYPIHGAANEHHPSQIAVTNHVDFVVFITRSRIEDDTTTGVGAGGANYFVVEPIETWIELTPEEQITLPVWFLGSEKQQSARLSIYTTAYQHRRLEVMLTGKTILE